MPFITTFGMIQEIVDKGQCEVQPLAILYLFVIIPIFHELITYNTNMVTIIKPSPDLNTTSEVRVKILSVHYLISRLCRKLNSSSTLEERGKIDDLP